MEPNMILKPNRFGLRKRSHFGSLKFKKKKNIWVNQNSIGFPHIFLFTIISYSIEDFSRKRCFTLIFFGKCVRSYALCYRSMTCIIVRGHMWPKDKGNGKQFEAGFNNWPFCVSIIYLWYTYLNATSMTYPMIRM